VRYTGLMHAAPLEVPFIAVLPFALLLLSIAVLPLALPHVWESNRNKGIIATLVSAPIAIWLVRVSPSALSGTALEYLSFLCLLGSLFVVAGGIHVAGDLRATPKDNILLFAIGAVLASFIGTTGASMVLIRLVLRTNSERKNTSHIPFFFILLIANCGGLLTPLGDPPLFLGYLRGVPFFWTLRLFPVWVLATTYLLTVFYFVDRKAYAAETNEARLDDDLHVEPVQILGGINIVLLLGIVGAVFLPFLYRELTMVALALTSLKFGSLEARRKNEFSFGPIFEVAIIFAGIFITMVPALELLREHGKALGLVAPWQYFLTTGALSSVLDNAPTYLTFLSAAQGLGLRPNIVGVTTAHLVAISAGAVLMGANTYIGNGPNFMVKAIADNAGYKTDNFLKYAGKAILTLSPVYLALVAYFVLSS
jgi:Na+/H+ antiporter NhaD/arsenite permease-like protein